MRPDPFSPGAGLDRTDALRADPPQSTRGPELTIDYAELEEARWFSREEIAAALRQREGASFLAPRKFAIARTLLEHRLAA